LIDLAQVGGGQELQHYVATGYKWGRTKAPYKHGELDFNPAYSKWELIYLTVKALFQPPTGKELEEVEQLSRAEKASKESESEGIEERAPGKKDTGK